MMRVKCKYILLWLCGVYLVFCLASCHMALLPPKPDALLSFLCEDFRCGFSVTEDGCVVANAFFVREAGCDTLTYEANGTRAVFCFQGGKFYLCTGANENEDALLLPVTLPHAFGVGKIHALFSNVGGSGEGTVTRTGEGYRLTLDQDVIWIFSMEMVPLSLTYGNTTLHVTSFQDHT